jgi:hypothetical protein
MAKAPAPMRTVKREFTAVDEAFKAEVRDASPDLLAQIESQLTADSQDWWTAVMVATPNPDWTNSHTRKADDFSRYEIDRCEQERGTLRFISDVSEPQSIHLNWDCTAVCDTAVLKKTLPSAGQSNCVCRNMHTDESVSSSAQHQVEHSTECLLQFLTEFLTAEILGINKILFALYILLQFHYNRMCTIQFHTEYCMILLYGVAPLQHPANITRHLNPITQHALDQGELKYTYNSDLG